MADFDFQAGVKSDGSEDQLAASIANAIDAAFKKLGPRLAKEFGNSFKQAFRQASGADDIFDGARRGAEEFSDTVRSLSDRLESLARAGAAQRKAFGEGFDPNTLDSFESSLKDIIELQDEIRRRGGDPGLEAEFRNRTNLIRSELTATRTAAQQATLASREALNAQARDANQVSRERIANKRAETARFVTETQTSAARELAIIRSNAQESVALTQAAAKRRAATFQLVATAVRSSERAIRATFENTARVASAALNGITRTASAVASGLGNAFRSANRSTVNNFNSANSQITNSYNRSWRRNTDIVNNELTRQEGRVRQFAREATEEVSSIGVGRLAGFAALGALAGRALTSGFQRAATLEDSERALTALLGSVEQAQELRQRVLDVVTGTPFALDQFANAATQLVAFNVEAEKVPRILQAVGDAAAVRGGDAAQTIERLVRVFGQIQSSGRLTGEDLNQLAEAGVPALQILANGFGELTGDMRDLISDGAVPAERALQLLTDGILEGSDGVNGATAAFGGLAKELGTTLRGSIGNFNAAFARLGATVITKFQPLLVNIVRSGTEAVDVLASAFASLGDAVIASPVFRIVGSAFERLGSQVETAGEKLKPVFDFLAEGLVAFGTAAGAVAGIRRLPLLINAITFAISRLLTPINVLVGAGILVSGFISRLVRDNPTLASSLSALGDSFGRIATIVGDLASDVFGTLAEVLDTVVTPAIGFLGDKIVEIVVPALERFNAFLVGSVIPVVRNFARFVRSEVVPVVGDVLSRAVEIGRDAFEDISDFIRDEVVPVVGPILRRAIDLGRGAFERFYDFLSGTLVPFIRNNLTPVLAGLGAALGVLTLTGGNIPLAGLVGAGAGIAAVLTNDDLRTRISDFFEEVVEDIREKFSNIFNARTLTDVTVAVARVARTIGRVLADALSDRRLLTAVAGVAAAAAAVAGAFVVGFGEGLINNIPELADLLGDAFVAALKAIASDARIATAVAAALFGAAVVAKLALAARQTGAVLAQALSQGAVTAGTQGTGGGAGGLLNGLLGGPSAIRASAAQAGQQYGETLTRAIRNEVRVIQRLGGNLPADALGLGRVAGESFADQNQRLSRTLQEVTRETGRLGSELGTAAVSGVRLREGLGQITSGNIRQGFQQLGTAIRESGREIATGAGIVAGGAFAASFIAQAIFDVNASGSDRLQAGFGLLATSVATGASIGGGAGAAAGAAVGAFGLVTSALRSNSEAAEEARQRIDDYAQAIRDASKEELPDLFADTAESSALENFSSNAKRALADIGFSFEEFGQAIAEGNLEEQFGTLEGSALSTASAVASFSRGFDLSGATFGLRELAALNLGELRTSLIASGASAVVVDEILAGLQATASQLGAAQARAADDINLLGAAGDRAGRGMQFLRDQTALTEGATGVAESATQAYKDKLEELNDVRIQGLEDQVNRSKSALDAARDAAGEALSALENFLSGGDAQASGSVVDQAVVDVAGLARDITGLGTVAEGAGAEVQAKFNLAFAEVRTNAAEVLAQGISDGTVTDQATAEAALAPLIAAAAETGTAGGEAALAAINEVLAGFTGQEGQSLLSDIFDANAFLEDAQTQLTAANARLKVGLEADPETFAGFEEQARAAFVTAGEESAAGYVEGLDSESMKTAATEAVAEALAAAKTELGISSPSTAFAEIGRFSAQGFINGVKSLQPQVFNAARDVGRFAMLGFQSGIVQGTSAVLAAARGVADRAAQVMRDALEVESPSRVTREIGEFFGEGFADGIDAGAASATAAAVRVANAALAPLNEAGRNAIREIGRGFAEEGSSFAGSVRGVLDDALRDAEFKLDQFKSIGRQIGSALFSQLPGSIGGAPGAVDLERAFLDILGNTGGFQEALKKQTDQFGFYGLTFDRQFAVGRENRTAFLEAGQNIRDYAQTLIDGGRSAASAVGEAKVYRDQLLAVAKATGQPVAIFEEMIRQLGLSDDQLNAFVANVEKTTKAASAATDAERVRIQAENDRRAAEERAEEAARAAEERAEKAERDAEQRRREDEDRRREADERARREFTLPGPAFRDLILQTPTSDPEAVALYVANQVAMQVRR
jgi:tape measure domain-containing protein